jgi:hypothetical protein
VAPLAYDEFLYNDDFTNFMIRILMMYMYFHFWESSGA